MPKKVGELKQTVEITNGFPGTYKWAGGTSYYLNGKPGTGEIHFSVNGADNEEFKSFHVTRDVNGSNVGIWFNADKISVPPNTNNLLSHKKPVQE
jgi:hypothetical protein